MSSDEIVGRFVERVGALADAEGPALDAAGLREIALELGMSEEDLARAEAEAGVRLEVGRGLAARGLLDEAGHELRLAVELAPYELEGLRALAQLHARRWRAAGDEDERQAGLGVLKRARKVAAEDAELAALQGELQRGVRPPLGGRSRGRGGGRGPLLVGLGLVLLLGTGLFVALLNGGAEGSGEGTPTSQEAGAGEVDRAALLVPREGDIIVAFEAGAALDGSELQVRESRSTTYEDSTWYVLRATLLNGSDSEIRGLHAQVDLLDEAGEVVASKSRAVLGSHEPPVRPGELVPMTFRLKTAEAGQGARVTLVHSELEPAAHTYPAAIPVEVRWLAPAPPAAELAFRARLEATRPHGRDGKVFHQLDLEVENTGQVAVSGLKMETRYSDAAGESLGVDTTWVVSTDEPSMRPGELRVVRILEILPRAFGARELVVSDAR